MPLATAKTLAFIGQTVMGVLLIVTAVYLSRDMGDDPTNLIASWFLGLSGLGCLLFGISTFFLRREPDIWS